MKKTLAALFFFLILFVYYLHQGSEIPENQLAGSMAKNTPSPTFENTSVNTSTLEEKGNNNTLKSYLMEVEVKDNPSFKSDNPFIECPFKVSSNYYQHSLYHYMNFTILKKGVVLANYNLKGVTGKYLCLSEGILLYAYYPGDVLGNTSMLFLDHNLSEKWKKEFNGLALPEYYIDKNILLIKHGSEEWNVKACLYKLNIETGEVISKFCPEPYYGSEILNIKVFKNRIYLTTSGGFLYLLEGNKSKNVFIETIEGIKLGARMKIDANEKYVVVAYFFANEIGEEENGLCIFTSELKKISCKKFENTPWDVKIKGNIIYVQFRNGEIKTYEITT